MKKKVSLALVLTFLLVTLIGCGKFECDLCGDEKSGKKYEEEVFGEEVTICKDCYEDLEELRDMFD